MMYRDLLAKELVSGLSPGEDEALVNLAQAYSSISEFVDSGVHQNGGLVPVAQAQVMRMGTVGRPSFEIPPSQLQYLTENRFSVP